MKKHDKIIYENLVKILTLQIKLKNIHEHQNCKPGDGLLENVKKYIVSLKYQFLVRAGLKIAPPGFKKFTSQKKELYILLIGEPRKITEFGHGIKSLGFQVTVVYPGLGSEIDIVKRSLGGSNFIPVEIEAREIRDCIDNYSPRLIQFMRTQAGIRYMSKNMDLANKIVIKTRSDLYTPLLGKFREPSDNEVNANTDLLWCVNGESAELFSDIYEYATENQPWGPRNVKWVNTHAYKKSSNSIRKGWIPYFIDQNNNILFDPELTGARLMSGQGHPEWPAERIFATYLLSRGVVVLKDDALWARVIR